MEIINAQNFPRDPKYRRLVLPYRDGEILVEADLSQAESMIVAWLSNETALMNKYKRGEDVHSYVASIIMEKKITKANKEERTVAKRIVHGSNYGMKPRKICEVLMKELCKTFPLKKAIRAQSIYFQNFSRIRSGYHRYIQDLLRDNRKIITTPTGFERQFWQPWGDELFRKAYAHYAQNIVAFITNNAINRLQKTKWRETIMMQNHDAVLLSVPRPMKAESITVLKQALHYPIVVGKEELVIPTEVKTGLNWGDMHDEPT